MEQKKPNTSRGTIAFVFVIILGYVLGLLIKRVQLGLLIGLALGLLGSGLLRSKR